jgi:ABC-type polysaccharide/polyol phosphate export permease
MVESVVSSPPPGSGTDVAEAWVHRSASGVEFGGETPTGRAAGPVTAFVSAAREVFRLRETLWVLVLKDFKGRYRAQALGLFWSLAHPLVMMGTLTLAFQYVLKVSIPNFQVFYLIGAVFWQFFTNAVLAATGGITENGGLIKHTTFPRYVFPIAAVLSHLIHFAMELGLVFAFFFFFPSAYRLNVTLLALPFVVLLLVVIAIGVGFATSVLHAKYRDVYYVVTSTITVGFWATPILFSTSMAPSWLRPLLRLNPVGGVIEAGRDVLMRGVWPDPAYLVPAMITAATVFFGGCYVFRRMNIRVADYV